MASYCSKNNEKCLGKNPELKNCIGIVILKKKLQIKEFA